MSFKIGGLIKVFAVGGLLGVATCATSAQTASSSQTSAQQSQTVRVFATPDEAVDKMVAAVRSDDKNELMRIMGPDSDKLLHSGDAVADKESREHFLASYDSAHKIQSDGDSRDVLVVGADEWPMPIPLVHSANGWWFNTAAGADEILNRRIGRNELNTIETCRSYVEAQQDYAVAQVENGNPGEFAQRFRSTEGKHDGLYWPVTEGEPESPLGSLIADATAEGYSEKAVGKHTPYNGYYFAILKKQGQNARGGARDYVVNGHMTRGFALVAFPAAYGDSGIMTFIINHNGIVYEKNLGPDTAKIASHMKQFDPDSSWNIVN